MIEESGSMTFKESHLRSIVKSVIYRMASILGTGILTWLITRDIRKTLSITFANQIFLIILYYLSERIWNRIHWGKMLQVARKMPKTS